MSLWVEGEGACFWSLLEPVLVGSWLLISRSSPEDQSLWDLWCAQQTKEKGDGFSGSNQADVRFKKPLILAQQPSTLAYQLESMLFIGCHLIF